MIPGEPCRAAVTRLLLFKLLVYEALSYWCMGLKLLALILGRVKGLLRHEYLVNHIVLRQADVRRLSAVREHT
jgi:hypothetical protein